MEVLFGAQPIKGLKCHFRRNGYNWVTHNSLGDSSYTYYRHSYRIRVCEATDDLLCLLLMDVCLGYGTKGVMKIASFEISMMF